MTKLSRLVQLANRPGTPAVGAAARRMAEHFAKQEGLELVETRTGELMLVDEFHADTLRALLDIADPPTRKELGNEIHPEPGDQ